MSNVSPFPLPDLNPTVCRDIAPGDPIPPGFVRLRDFGVPADGYLGYACRMGYLPSVKVRRTDGDRNGPVYVHRLAALRYLNRVHPNLVPTLPGGWFARFCRWLRLANSRLFWGDR